MNNQAKMFCFRHNRGAALMLVIIVLVVLTTIVYGISSSVSRWKHRQQYIIDYQVARYACESGLKYALAVIESIKPEYVSRPNEPDFSDLFTMSDEDYKQMMQDWAQEQFETRIDANNLSKNDYAGNSIDFSSMFNGDANDSNTADFNSLSANMNLFNGGDINDLHDVNALNALNPENFFVRGPYGPPWPYVTEPAEIEFGDAHVKIEIIDENAKLPLNWGICADPNAKREMNAAVVTFCEWMQMEPNDIELLLEQLDTIKEVKPFSVNLKPVVTASSQQQPEQTAEEKANLSRSRISRLRRERARRSGRARVRTVQETRPEIGHTRDFAKLLHSPMIDLQKLAKPVNQDENRSESALKYISLWGTGQVNVNTAPRQVLEAAFTFGGDAVEIAEQIILLRKEEPFKNIDDLKKRLFSYTDSIDKSSPYITTESSYFVIRAKATSGVASVSATAGIKKEGNKFQKIGIIIE